MGEKRDSGTLKTAYGGMMAALVFVATCFIRLPVSMQGYVHPGDGFILLGASLLGWTAVPAAAIGSLLADLIAGYAVYCLPSFIIKGAVAAVAVVATGRLKPYWRTVALLMLAELIMVGGYFLVEWLCLGYGLYVAAGDVPPNLLQGLSGVVIGGTLIPAFGGLRKQLGMR